MAKVEEAPAPSHNNQIMAQNNNLGPFNFSPFMAMPNQPSVPMFPAKSSNFLTASVNKFIQVWALGGTAYLNLTTSNGQATVSFNCTLGHPGALHSLPPSVPASPPPRQPRHSGLTELVRNRQRAAHHQAARAMASATSPSSVTAPVTPMAMSTD